MKKVVKNFWICISFVVGLTISSCERSTNQIGKISIKIPTYVQNEVGTLSNGAPPNSASEIDCFGFLVSNSDSGSDRARCKLNSGSTGSFSRSIQFKKAVGGFYSGDNAEFEVDAGQNRVLHVVGLKTNLPSGTATTQAACRQMLTGDFDSFSKPFLIASSNPFSVTSGSTQVVTVTNGYVPNSTEYFDDCEGPGAPGGGDEVEPGPPVKAKIVLQDGLTSIYSNSCVAAAVELYDANNRLTRADQSLSFSVTATGSGSEVITSGDFCDLTGTTTGSVNFSANDYGRRVFFVKYVLTGNYTLTMSSPVPTIVVEFPANIFVESYLNATLSVNAPLRYSIFDVFSFKSTFSSRPSNPIDVEAGECRSALVQIVDNQGRPIKAVNNGGAPSEIATIVESAIPLGAVPLFSHFISCTTSLVVPENLGVGNSNPSGFLKFKYQVPSTAAFTLFKLKVYNNGGGFIGVSGDINPLDPASTNPNFNNSYWNVKD